jgi:N6-adenosine-specific RNA methylase IME4/ParB-like chromosome segregation protein Spo0J
VKKKGRVRKGASGKRGRGHKTTASAVRSKPRKAAGAHASARKRAAALHTVREGGGKGVDARHKAGHDGAESAAKFSPYIQPVRWPREISLARIIARKDLGDVAALAKSIDERGGLLQPIVIIADAGKDYLIAGQRRLAAWALSRFRKEPIPVHEMPSIDSILQGEWDENAHRKDFALSESVELADAILPELKRKAAARQQAGKKIDAEAAADGGEVLEHVARLFGMSRPTLERARAVVQAAREQPKKFSDLLAAMDKSGKANGPFKRLQVRRQVEDIAEKKKNGKLDLPAGKYDRIVADMPWPHEPGNEKPDRATRPYATMAIEAMCAMPVGKRLAKSCVLYFWTTNFHMEWAFNVMRAWGFDKFPTIITWAKDQAGRGQRLREATEHCIVAIKGNPVWQLTDQTTLIRGASGEHSEKPREFYALIDTITPAQRSLELFARRALPDGWEGYGDQVGTLATAKAKDAKAEKDDERLRQRAIECGHAIAADETGGKVSVTCQCGWGWVSFSTPEGIASKNAAIEAHWREVTALSFRAEAAEKSARRGSKRGKRPAAEGKPFNDHGVPGHTIRMHNEGARARATCECGGFSCEHPWNKDGIEAREREVQAHWTAVRAVAALAPAQPAMAEAAE